MWGEKTSSTNCFVSSFNGWRLQKGRRRGRCYDDAMDRGTHHFLQFDVGLVEPAEFDEDGGLLRARHDEVGLDVDEPVEVLERGSGAALRQIHRRPSGQRQVVVRIALQRRVEVRQRVLEQQQPQQRQPPQTSGSVFRSRRAGWFKLLSSNCRNQAGRTALRWGKTERTDVESGRDLQLAFGHHEFPQLQVLLHV